MSKLLLINPKNSSGVLSRVPFLKVPPLNLEILKKLSEDYFDVEIVDENVNEIDYSKKNDLVGITSMTSTVGRAYSIAKKFEGMDTPVVLGGIHTSILPEEAAKYVTSVFIGEAEGGKWLQLIKDFKNKNLKKFYNGGIADIKDIPIISKRMNSYFVGGTIQTARGCPVNCKFCSVTLYIMAENIAQGELKKFWMNLRQWTEKML